MANESERDLIKAAVLIEEMTKLLQALCERLRVYHETTNQKIDALPRLLTDHITLEVSSKLRTLRYQERQADEADTRVDNVLVRRDPTPPWGITLPPHVEQTGQVAIQRPEPWYARVLGSVPWQAWWAVFGAAGLYGARLLAKVLHGP